MPILVPLAALQKGPVQLVGEISPADLALETRDPCIETKEAVGYDLTVRQLGREIFAEGAIFTRFECQCVRCLETFEHVLRLDPWMAILDLDGEEAVPIVHEAVDLTPQIREDTLLGLPQHPMCRPDCRGMALQHSDSGESDGPSNETRRDPSAWSILDTLKLDR